MSEHTPGTWFVWGGTELIIKAKNRVIACASQEREDDWEKAKANARLIAAAPELLEALEAIIERWDTPLWKDVPHTAEYIDAARLIVAKAKGE